MKKEQDLTLQSAAEYRETVCICGVEAVRIVKAG